MYFLIDQIGDGMKIICKSLIAVFAAFVLVACNSDEDSTVSNAGEAASEAVDGTLESISGALDSVTESAGDMVDSASDVVGDAVDSASEMAADAADSISDMTAEADDTDAINEVDTSAIDKAKAEVDALME